MGSLVLIDSALSLTSVGKARNHSKPGAQVRRIAVDGLRTLAPCSGPDGVLVNLECVDEPGHPDVFVARDDVFGQTVGVAEEPEVPEARGLSRSATGNS